MALLWLRYETDAIYERVKEEVEANGGAEACMPQISGFHRRLPASLPALRRISLAALKPAHNLSLSVALDQNQ